MEACAVFVTADQVDYLPCEKFWYFDICFLPNSWQKSQTIAFLSLRRHRKGWHFQIKLFSQHFICIWHWAASAWAPAVSHGSCHSGAPWPLPPLWSGLDYIFHEGIKPRREWGVLWEPHQRTPARRGQWRHIWTMGPLRHRDNSGRHLKMLNWLQRTVHLGLTNLNFGFRIKPQLFPSYFPVENVSFIDPPMEISQLSLVLMPTRHTGTTAFSPEVISGSLATFSQSCD